MKKLTYIPQLDGVRTIAVMLVIAFHCGLITFGWVGVNLFFVLSGFLISSILFNMSVKEGYSVWEKLKVFYVRRFLRIFPPYYAYILLLFVFTSVAVYFYSPNWLKEPYLSFKNSFISLLSYTYNIYGALTGTAHKWQAHFWSLAVEEQFYLFWPILILTVRRRRMLLLIIMVIVSLMFRGLVAKMVGGIAISEDQKQMLVYWLPLSQFDSFAMGGILAVLFVYDKLKDINISIYALFSIVLLLTLNIIFIKTNNKSMFLLFENLGFIAPIAPYYFSILIPFAYHLLLSVFIAFVIIKSDNLFVKYVLENNIFLYIGKISYGVYLYHYFILWSFKALLAKLGFSPQPMVKNMALFILTSGFTIFIAHLSYKYLEKPFLRMKNNFRL